MAVTIYIKMANFPIIGGFCALAEVQSANEHSINVFPQKNEGKTLWRMASSPGLKPYMMNVGNGPARAALEINGRAFVVHGSQFCEIFADLTFVVRGTLASSVGRVSIDNNGLQVVMTDGINNAYIFTFIDNSFVMTDDVDYYISKTVAVVDGFAVFVRDGTGQYFYSDLYEARTYIASDFASAESNPDILIAVANDPVGLLGLGDKTLEIYWDTGNVQQVFQRRQGARIGVGCIAPYSAVTIDGSTIWVGKDNDGIGGLYRLVAGSPAKVSNIPLDQAMMRSAVTLKDATAFGYKQGGNSFYCLNIPGTDTTFVYDTTTGFIHERRSFNGVPWGRWWAETHLSAFGKNIVGDYRNGNLYELDLSYYFDGDSQIIRRERSFRPIFDDADYTNSVYEGVAFDMLVGVGLVNTPYNDPQLELQISRDNGVTFGHSRFKSVGKIGEYETRVKFRRLSVARTSVFRIVYTYPTPFAVNGGYIDARK